ncbi:DUF6443 domain-containing protein [Bacteroides caecimuris]|uniref:DUF6443 domain-containing protein n=1 Tax=Bacteroides caecimuris TaxID=1796613 RepID=UPI001C3DB6E4|nr:RHS repeat-associated core domain-containing protein [Bacteroides caecimuris]
MKKIFAFILLSSICIVLSGSEHFSAATTMERDSASFNRSFIHKQTMLSDKGDSMLEEYRYFDGLGKPVQTVWHEISPAKGDLISTFTYDSIGRLSQQWLPLHVVGNNGASVIDPFNAIVKQYADKIPYQHFGYDYSPQSRVVLRQDAGKDWENNPVRMQYFTNDTTTAALTCTCYQVNDAGDLYDAGVYEPGELWVAQVTDEDGKVSYTFVDKENRTVLTRNADKAEWHDTYYVYDIKGNLRYVLTPMYQEHQDLKRYAYQYGYDSRNRHITSVMPGGDTCRYVYDKTDRLIYVQNSLQRQKQEWVFSIADEKGREAIKGTGIGFSVNVPPVSDVRVYAKRVRQAGAMKSGYYIYNLLGMSYVLPKEVSYYDDYSFLSNHENEIERLPLEYGLDDFPSWLEKQKDSFSTPMLSPVGLKSGKRSYLDDNTSLLTVFYYDNKGRIIQQRGTNHLGGYDIYFYSYTFTGLTKGCVHLQLDSGRNVVIAEYCNFIYDNGERLKQVKHTLNGGQESVLSENEYDDLCRLKKVKLNNGTMTLGYDYNIRNWLTSIESPLFKQKMYYVDGAGIPCYNGNISSVTWQSALSGKLSGYKFSYDGLNRMKDAMYGEGSSLDVNPGYFNEQVAGYDKNGNMLGIKRSGKLSENSYGLIDDLLMAYDGNRLLAVKDKAGQSVYSNAFEFVDGADEATEYFYDASGNLIKDLNKKIVDIQYNYLNLPSRIEFENGDSIVYLYDANGTKLRATHVIGDDTTVTDYCGNVVYENGVPRLLLTETGYVSLNDDKYHYFIQDYQGNNRVVADEDGIVEEVNDYYPFGGLMASSVGSVQPYKYNGKELDRKGGLDWYDYGARHYDAVLGRWHAADPSSEKYYNWSPYTYCKNNPVLRIDLDGKDDYKISETGKLSRTIVHGSSEDRLFSSNSNVKPVIVKNKELLSDMFNMQYDKMNPSRKIHVSTTELEDAATVFKFAADHTRVEWKLDIYDDNGSKSAIIGTDRRENSVFSNMQKELKISGVKVFDLHSHPYNQQASDNDMKVLKIGKGAIYHKDSKTLFFYDEQNNHIQGEDYRISTGEDLFKLLRDLLKL